MMELWIIFSALLLRSAAAVGDSMRISVENVRLSLHPVHIVQLYSNRNSIMARGEATAENNNLRHLTSGGRRNNGRQIGRRRHLSSSKSDKSSKLGSIFSSGDETILSHRTSESEKSQTSGDGTKPPVPESLSSGDETNSPTPEPFSSGDGTKPSTAEPFSSSDGTKPPTPEPFSSGNETKPPELESLSSGDDADGEFYPVLLALGAIGALGGYYINRTRMDSMPRESKDKKKKPECGCDEKKAYPELKETEQQMIHAKEKDDAPKKSEKAVEDELPELEETGTESSKEEESEEEKESSEHTKQSNHVEMYNMSSFYKTILEGAKQQLEEAAAAQALTYNEFYKAAPADLSAALSSATAAMNEVQSNTSLEFLHTLAAAHAELRNDFKHFDILKESELRGRVVKLATEMVDGTKLEAVRQMDFLAMKEKEVCEK